MVLVGANRKSFDSLKISNSFKKKKKTHFKKFCLKSNNFVQFLCKKKKNDFEKQFKTTMNKLTFRLMKVLSFTHLFDYHEYCVSLFIEIKYRLENLNNLHIAFC